MTTTINGTTAAAAPAQSASDYMKATTGLNKDDFLKLFITQLQNQDPLSPQDTSTMVTQLSQITQVEQAYNTNQNLQSLLSATNSASNMTAVSFIGKTITAPGSTVNLAAGGARVAFSLDHAASQVAIAIKDPAGRTVRTLTAANPASGTGSVAWDGKDDNGATLAPGSYGFSVTGTNTDGTTFAGTPLIRGVVDGVKLAQGTTVLSTGGVDVPLASVTAVTNGG